MKKLKMQKSFKSDKGYNNLKPKKSFYYNNLKEQYFV